MITLNYRQVSLCLVLSLLLPVAASAQLDPTGAYVLDSGERQVTPTTDSHVSTLGAAQDFFAGLFFGFDIARDMELVVDESGFVTGYYLLDGFGAQHEVGTVEAYNVPQKPYFNWDIARDLEVVNTLRLVTDAVSGQVIGAQVTGQTGYYVTDGFGGVHPVNNSVDLPLRRADPNNTFFRVHNDFPSSYPAPSNFPYFAPWDIVRDMEVSYSYRLVTDTKSSHEEIVGESNGYYLLDGLGGVHNARLDITDTETPYTPVYAPWEFLARPYFNWDVARDFEVTPRGDGYYLLDGLGGIHPVNASLNFGEGVPGAPPYFGFDTAKDIELVHGPNGQVTGYYVLDGFGQIHVLGNAPDLGQVVNPGTITSDIFRDLEVSPVFQPITLTK